MGIGFTKKVLLIDEETSFLRLVSAELQKEDERINVIPASSTSEALNLLDNEDFDAIVSSRRIQEIEGIKLLNEVRKKKEMEIPFVILSRQREKEFVLKALKQGANRILEKENEDKNNIILSCKILAETLKQEIQSYENKKELEHHRKEFNRNFKIYDI